MQGAGEHRTGAYCSVREDRMRSWQRRRWPFMDRFLGVVAAEQQARVHAAESEGVREGEIDARAAGGVGDVVEIARGVGMVQVDRGGEDLPVDREDGEHGLDAARGAQQV